MKKRSGFQVMLRLVGLVRPLAGFMAVSYTHLTLPTICSV